MFTELIRQMRLWRLRRRTAYLRAEIARVRDSLNYAERQLRVLETDQLLLELRKCPI